jgi:hypothetical protein
MVRARGDRLNEPGFSPSPRYAGGRAGEGGSSDLGSSDLGSSD